MRMPSADNDHLHTCPDCQMTWTCPEEKREGPAVVRRCDRCNRNHYREFRATLPEINHDEHRTPMQLQDDIITGRYLDYMNYENKQKSPQAEKPSYQKAIEGVPFHIDGKTETQKANEDKDRYSNLCMLNSMLVRLIESKQEFFPVGYNVDNQANLIKLTSGYIDQAQKILKELLGDDK